MKQKVLKLMCLLCVGMMSMSAWGADKTITLTATSFGLTSSYQLKTATVDGFSFTVNKGFLATGGNAGAIQMNSSQGSGILYNTTPIPGLKSVTVTVKSGSKTYTVTTGNASQPTANSQTGTTGGTYNAVNGDTYFKLLVSGASYFTNIVITYDAGTETTTSISDAGLTTTSWGGSDLAAGSFTATVTPEGESALASPTIAWSSSDTDVATIDPASGAVTLKGEGTTTITATYAGVSGTYIGSSDTYDLVVTDSRIAYTTTTIDASGITNTNVVTSTAAGTLSASVTYDNSGTPTAVPGAAVTWTSSNPSVATITSAGVVTLVAAGTTTITASYAGTTGYSESSNTYVLNVTDGYTHDIINQSLTGVTGSTYTFVENLTATSSAVYSVQCAGGNSSVQLRSNNNNSGIFSTTSGGYARKVKVTWNSNTSNGRTLNVYGKNTPYVKDGTSASILYSTTTQGTLLGTIVYGTSTELAITGDYAYIALRSDDGAMYLTDIDIAWEPVYNITVSTSGYATFYSSEHAYTMPAGLTGFAATNPSAGKITLKPAYSAGDVVPAGVALVLKGSADDYTLAWTTGGVAPAANLLKGTDTDATTTGADKYYKLSYDSTGENLGFYWATAEGAAFTNGAHKAYLALTDAQASSVKGFRLDFDEATGINGITPALSKGEGVIYNLNGQRVNSLQKGINIVGGKKVLVK